MDYYYPRAIQGKQVAEECLDERRSRAPAAHPPTIPVSIPSRSAMTRQARAAPVHTLPLLHYRGLGISCVSLPSKRGFREAKTEARLRRT